VRCQVVRTLRVLATGVRKAHTLALALLTHWRGADCWTAGVLFAFSMQSSCNDFVSNHGEEIETILYKGQMTDRDIREKLCIQTKICDRLWTDEEEETKVSSTQQRREGKFVPTNNGLITTC
jgi:hypothetical protein